MDGSNLLLAGVLFCLPPSSRSRLPRVSALARCWAICWQDRHWPLGLGFISDVDEILHFSELGVVFLMFIIGLELNTPPSAGNYGNPIFTARGGAGVTQRGHSRGTADVDAVFLAGRGDWRDRSCDVVDGDGASADARQGMNRNEAGQLGFSVLLFQDLAVIPALALVPLLAGSGRRSFRLDEDLHEGAGFAGMLIGGRFLLRPVFRFIAHPACARYSPPQRCCWCLARRCLWMRWGCR